MCGRVKKNCRPPRPAAWPSSGAPAASRLWADGLRAPLRWTVEAVLVAAAVVVLAATRSPCAVAPSRVAHSQGQARIEGVWGPRAADHPPGTVRAGLRRDHLRLQAPLAALAVVRVAGDGKSRLLQSPVDTQDSSRRLFPRQHYHERQIRVPTTSVVQPKSPTLTTASTRCRIFCEMQSKALPWSSRDATLLLLCSFYWASARRFPQFLRPAGARQEKNNVQTDNQNGVSGDGGTRTLIGLGLASRRLCWCFFGKPRIARCLERCKLLLGLSQLISEQKNGCLHRSNVVGQLGPALLLLLLLGRSSNRGLAVVKH
eukprot:m.125005 g.125005  ORF g.125005 m.125005 type:complete len:315 (-) comp9684_c0_seq4:1667-2611(-)